MKSSNCGIILSIREDSVSILYRGRIRREEGERVRVRNDKKQVRKLHKCNVQCNTQ